MIISINKADYSASTDFNTLGYVGENNVRPVTLKNYLVDNATAYKLVLSYSDGTVYEVDVTDGTFTPTSSILRLAETISAQLCAKRLENGVYTIVQKSNIFSLVIKPSICDDAAPIPISEDACTYLDEMIELKEQTSAFSQSAQSNADKCSKALQTVISSSELAPNILPISAEYWEQGGISTASGLPIVSEKFLRTKDYINVNPSTTYTITKFSDTGKRGYFEYDKDGKLVNVGNWTVTQAQTFTTTATTRKVIVILMHPNSEVTTTDELMSYYKFSMCKSATASPLWQYPILEDITAQVNERLDEITNAIISTGGNI